MLCQLAIVGLTNFRSLNLEGLLDLLTELNDYDALLWSFFILFRI